MQSTLFGQSRRVILFAVVVFLFAIGATAFAQEGGQTNKPQLSERLQERIINLASNVVNRTDAAIKRLDNIAGRIDSRMDKLEAEGVDTTLPLERFNQGMMSLQSAKDIQSTLISASSAISSDNPGQSFATLIETYRKIRQDLNVAHQAFTDTVQIMKDLSGSTN